MSSYPVPKQILDRGISLLLIVVLAPVFAIVLAAMGIDMLVSRRDRGRWLYRERRVSRGREFDLLKFRTLRRDVLERTRSEEAHARLHEGDEQNLTWAGRRVLKP
jgi:lipopolysaccharide/colanic/teichoic acid biosynthesis glycosyltransferase